MIAHPAHRSFPYVIPCVIGFGGEFLVREADLAYLLGVYRVRKDTNLREVLDFQKLTASVRRIP